MRQLLTESVLLGAVGGAVGLGVAYVAMRLLVRLSPGDIPRLENVSIDPATLAFAAIVSIATGILFGLAPTIVAWKGGAQESLREHVRGPSGDQGARARSILTSAEIAFALVLLVGAGLMARSFAGLLAKDLGFKPVNIPESRYPKPADNVAVVERVLAGVRAIPGVAEAGASTSMPPARIQMAGGFSIEGDPAAKPGQEPSAIIIPTTSGFLGALGIPIAAGRPFGDRDGLGSPRVMIVSRELVRRHFAGRDPIGRRIQFEDSLWTIVGVAGDVTYQGIGSPIRPVIYVPWAQSTLGGAWIAVRTSADPRSVIGAIPAAVHAADPLMNPRELRSMDEMVGDTMVRPRFQTWLLTTFGGLALVLAAVGIYGVIAYGVAQRTAEIGLRLALGAPPRSVVRLLLRRGMIPVAIGIIVGLAAAAALTRLMSSILVGVSPTDAPTFAGMAILLGSVAMIAAYLPAARATNLEPVSALRSD